MMDPHRPLPHSPQEPMIEKCEEIQKVSHIYLSGLECFQGGLCCVSKLQWLQCAVGKSEWFSSGYLFS